VCYEIFENLLELVEARNKAIHLVHYADKWNGLRKLVDCTFDNLHEMAIASQEEELSKVV